MHRKWKHQKFIRRQVRDVQLTTGVDNKSAARIVTADLVEKTLHNMVLMGFGSHQMYRVIRFKLGHIKDLTNEERQFADTLIGELACVKGLAREAWLDLEVLERYAWTGYQRLGIEFDPLFACIKESYKGGTIRPDDIDQDALRKFARECGATEFRKLLPSAWLRATNTTQFYEEEPEAARIWLDILVEVLDPNLIRILENFANAPYGTTVSSSRGEAIATFLEEVRLRKSQAA
jgi:hypothetical protein